MKALFVGITLDPNGVYIAHDLHFNLYRYHAGANVWIYIDPSNYGTEIS